MPSLRPLLEPRFTRWLPWLMAVVATGIAARNLIGGYADLGIYLDVAREFVAGGFDLSRDRPESGPWIYPHFAALPFVMLQQLLGTGGARWAWCLLLGLGTGLLLRDLIRLLAFFGGLAWWQWLVFGVLFQRCIAQNLTHGQLSLWVAVFVTRGALDLANGRDARAGICFGLATACKVTPALFLLALPLMGRSRAAMAMLVTTLLAMLLVPWPFCGTEEHLRHLADFWRAISQSLLHPEQARIVQSYAGPSIHGALDYLLQPKPLNEDGDTVNLFAVSDNTLAVARWLWSAVLGAVLLAWFVRARRFATAQRLVLQSSSVLLAISFFSPLVRTYHLAASLLPFALFCRGPGPRRRDWLWYAATTGLLFAQTLRQKKLLGETLWRALDGGAFMHVAMVLLTVWLLRDSKREPAPASPPPN